MNRTDDLVTSSVNKEEGLNRPLTQEAPRYILAPWVPTPEDVVERMLQLADVTSQDLVYDLGCGDGRVIITAARKYGARGVGVDIEPYWVAESQVNAKRAGVDHLVTFKLQDVMTADLSPATVVMLYLVAWSTSRVQPLIKRQIKPGTRVVSHSFSGGDWIPVKTENFTDASGSVRNIHLWIMDAPSGLT